MNLLAYIQGRRKGKEAHRIEKKAMQDPFLAEALDGFDEIAGNHVERIAQIRKRLSLATRHSNRRSMYISIAASLLLCFTIGGYFLLHKEPKNFLAQRELNVSAITEEEMVLSSKEEFTESADVAEEELPIRQPPSTQDSENSISLADKEVVSLNAQHAPPPTPVTIIVDDAFVIVDQDVRMQAEMESIEQVELNDSESFTLRDTTKLLSQADKMNKSKDSQEINQRTVLGKSTPVKSEPQIGMKAYRKYLQEAMVRPKEGECAKAKGVVEIEFKIKEGRPYDFKVKRSLCDAADKEAIRLIENGSSWMGDSDQVILKVRF